MSGMLVPQFTLRWILGLTLGVILLSLLAQQAYGGALWAFGVLAALGAVVALFILMAALFLVAWALSVLIGLAGPRHPGQSPFATDAPPPQWVPSPRE